MQFLLHPTLCLVAFLFTISLKTDNIAIAPRRCLMRQMSAMSISNHVCLHGQQGSCQSTISIRWGLQRKQPRLLGGRFGNPQEVQAREMQQVGECRQKCNHAETSGCSLNSLMVANESNNRASLLCNSAHELLSAHHMLVDDYLRYTSIPGARQTIAVQKN